MAALDREAIYVSLLALLQSIPGIKTPCSRTFRDLDKVDQTEMPAMFLVAGDEVAEHSKGRPTKWTLRPNVFLYVRTDPETGVAPSTIINAILKSIETALMWANGDGPPLSPDAQTTLGNLCSHCWILKNEIGEGIDTGQGVAISHLDILALGQFSSGS